MLAAFATFSSDQFTLKLLTPIPPDFYVRTQEAKFFIIRLKDVMLPEAMEVQWYVRGQANTERRVVSLDSWGKQASFAVHMPFPVSAPTV